MEDDGDDKDDSKRRTRNLSEKKRRDQFNMLVHELGTMIATNNRKMDKSTILKSTIAFLKNHNELTELARAHDVQEEWKPAFLSNEEFIYLVLEALEGFVIVFSALGRIYYVSESVASLLGHNPNDVMNKNIFDFVYEEDRTNLYGLLQHPDMSVHAPPGANTENEIRFHCHLRRGTLDFRDEVTYELIQFNGHFRTDIEQNENCDLSFEDENESRLIYFCIAKLCTPQLVRDVSLADANRKEFTSRHSLEWKFLFLDHRAPPIIGYLPFEVLGTSGYDYYHFDDLEKVVTCHEALMQKGELTSCYYRFLTKGQQWIWLQSRFYITYHQWHSKPEFVVCTHRVVSYVDVDTTTKQEITEQEITDQDIRNEPEASLSEMKEPSPEPMISVSPPYMSETNEVFGNYQSPSQAQSVKSTAASAGSICATVATVGTATTTAASWPRASQIRYTADSDTASVSGESRSSQRNGSQEVVAISVQDTQLVPQHNIGAQYLEPVPYVGAVGMPGVLPLPISTLPVIVSPGQAQIQEQLQRTHRELQHMIVRQQEELRQVKEQLMLARLGIFQPIINVQDHYGHAEEMLHASRIPAQIVYDGTQPRALAGFPPHQLHPSQPQLLPSQSQLLPSQPQLLPSQPQLLSTQSQLLPSQPQLLPAQPHPMQTLPTQLHLTQMHPQQQHTSTQHSSLQHPSQQHSSQQYSSQQLSSQQQPSQQQVSQKHPFQLHQSQQHQSQQHQSQQHQSHQQQQSQQHQLLQNQSLQNQSLQNQSLQNQSQQHPSQQHTSQQNQLQQHQTQQNQAQQNQLQQHQSQQHQSQQHKSHQHPSQQHSAQQQTSQQHPSQQHPSQQDLSQQHPAQQQTLQQQTFEQQTLQQQTLQQQTLQQQTLQQQTLQQQTLQHQTLQQQTLQLQTLQQQTLQHQKLQQQTLQLQTLQQQTLQQQTLKQQTLQQQTLQQQTLQQQTSQQHSLQQQTSQQHSLQQHLSQQHPSQHHSTQQHPSQQQSLQQQSLQQQSLQQHLSQQHLSQQHPSQQNQVQQHPTQSHLSQLQQQLQAHHDLQNQYNANLSHSPQ